METTGGSQQTTEDKVRGDFIINDYSSWRKSKERSRSDRNVTLNLQRFLYAFKYNKTIKSF